MIQHLFVKLINRRRFFQPFAIQIFFTLIGNFLQLGSFYALKKLNSQTFALVNFGFYCIALLGTLLDAFSKWVTIRLSKKDDSERILYSRSILRSSFIPIISILICETFLIWFLTKNSLLIIVLCGINSIIGYLNIFPRSWILIKERFLFLNYLGLIMPIMKLAAIIFLTNNAHLSPLFIVLIISSIITLIINTNHIEKTDKVNFYSLSIKDNSDDKINLKHMLFQSFIQLGMSIFWIADGIILKRVLSDNLYSIYVTYANIYKFPLFISVSIFSILLGKKYTTAEDVKELKKIFVFSILLILFSFGVVLTVECIKEGFILSILGYSRYLIPGFTYIFGLAWLVHTILYFFYAYLLKSRSDHKFLQGIIFFYGMSFITIVVLSGSDIQHLMRSIFIHGLIFLIAINIMVFSKHSSVDGFNMNG